MSKAKQSKRDTGRPEQFITEGEWLYHVDRWGDCRATNERLGLRTRLKASKEAAADDIKIGRLQKRISGEWVDRIR